jgi:ribonuclease P protein component
VEYHKVEDTGGRVAPRVISVSGISRQQGRNHPARRAGGFPRQYRLLKHADFDRVYRQGQRHFSGHMTVFYLRREAGNPRCGFTVGRALGGAVQRNRIRRRLREAVRRHFPALAAPVDVVINPKRSVLTAEFAVLCEEVGRAFELIAQRTGK